MVYYDTVACMSRPYRNDMHAALFILFSIAISTHLWVLSGIGDGSPLGFLFIFVVVHLYAIHMSFEHIPWEIRQVQYDTITLYTLNRLQDWQQFEEKNMQYIMTLVHSYHMLTLVIEPRDGNPIFLSDINQSHNSCFLVAMSSQHGESFNFSNIATHCIQCLIKYSVHQKADIRVPGAPFTNMVLSCHG